MKLSQILVINLVSLTSIVVAGYLAGSEKDGWGYFLFVAFLCHHWVNRIE